MQTEHVEIYKNLRCETTETHAEKTTCQAQCNTRSQQSIYSRGMQECRNAKTDKKSNRKETKVRCPHSAHLAEFIRREHQSIALTKNFQYIVKLQERIERIERIERMCGDDTASQNRHGTSRCQTQQCSQRCSKQIAFKVPIWCIGPFCFRVNVVILY